MKIFQARAEDVHPNSILRCGWLTLMQNPVMGAAALMLAIVILVACLGPFIAPHDPVKTDLAFRLASPA